MNHNTKPHFQSVVDRQRLAHYHLTGSTTRTAVELASFERHLTPCPVSDVELPRMPLVRLKALDEFTPLSRWVLLGEVAQMPGKVILLNIDTGAIEFDAAERLEMVPPTELR